MAEPRGYHLVRLFDYGGEETRLPPGWKPYADAIFEGKHKIVARLWVTPKKDLSEAVAWAEATTREAARVATQ